jgi:Methyltransferase domain
MYRTRHFPAEFTRPAGSAFINRALWYYGRRALKRKALGLFRRSHSQWRDATSVKAAYDAERGYTLEHLDRLSFDELVYGSADRFDQVPDSDFILLADEVIWGRTRDSRQFLVREMERRIAALVPAGGTVAEIGSGSGRNLLYLKSRLPDRRFVGFELSPVSATLARQLSARFGYDVEFSVANACEPIATPPPIDVVFSSHALEMMPRMFVGAVDNMLRIARTDVLFFEPIPELWPRDRRGRASRLRAYVMDRLDGFMPALAARLRGSWKMRESRRLGTSTNPINETVLVHLSRT